MCCKMTKKQAATKYDSPLDPSAASRIVVTVEYQEYLYPF